MSCYKLHNALHWIGFVLPAVLTCWYRGWLNLSQGIWVGCSEDSSIVLTRWTEKITAFKAALNTCVDLYWSLHASLLCFSRGPNLRPSFAQLTTVSVEAFEPAPASFTTIVFNFSDSGRKMMS
ncbi:Uncharacterized protein Rs2_36074 [Raphanus sativus]|uniref:Uncharacterized protein LOC130498843 n=1 Tax=Raphanus sativus TaxID=3726 RepID=A0A9W3CA59_RAPSA|nr:uncharacterized protein LOC130498843 [Raphanus sativus]KAJ4879020.1 Uncharacterized protein Rs2_36074 [Raphanus sativus]